MNIKIFIILSYFILIQCVSLKQDNSIPKPPDEDSIISTKELTLKSIQHGGEYLTKSNNLIIKRKQRNIALKSIFSWVENNKDSDKYKKLINAIHLYQKLSPIIPEKMFTLLNNSNKSTTRKMSWHIAASYPSNEMGTEIERILTSSILKNTLKDQLFPQMPDALANNNLKNTYTIARQGLHLTNQLSYAQSMTILNKNLANIDFLNYLKKASIEELRQLNLKNIDIITSSYMLDYLKDKNFPMTSKNMKILFYFSISRNNALAELANRVLINKIPEYGEDLSITLSTLPTWMQTAYIESQKEEKTQL